MVPGDWEFTLSDHLPLKTGRVCITVIFETMSPTVDIYLQPERNEYKD